MGIDSWSPIGGYDFVNDRVALLPGYTIAPAFTRGTAQLLKGEPEALEQLGSAIKEAAGDLPIVRLVVEVTGGTPSESRVTCQLIYGISDKFDHVDYTGAREELTSHPQFVGRALAELARRRAANG